jgi:hypothetical protein
LWKIGETTQLCNQYLIFKEIGKKIVVSINTHINPILFTQLQQITKKYWDGQNFIYTYGIRCYIKASQMTFNVCSHAAFHGNLRLLVWLRLQNNLYRVQHKESVNIDLYPWDANVCAYAASGGYIHILEWVRNPHFENGSTLENETPCPWDEDACYEAVKNNKLTTLVWLRSQDPPCPFSEKTCMTAVSNLKILKWLRKPHTTNKGVLMGPCPWDEWTFKMAVECHEYETVKWIISHNVTFPCNILDLEKAVKLGYITKEIMYTILDTS